jgi:hypothetical protein
MKRAVLGMYGCTADKELAMAARRFEQHAWVDEQVRRTDPVRPSVDESAMASSLEEAGRLILQYASKENERPRRRPVLRAPRRLVLIAVLVLGTSGAAAAASGVFVNANTHTYAGREYFHHGGAPGQFLNLAGTNLAKVVKKDSAGAGITFPSGSFDWRSYAIKEFATPRKCPSGSPRGCKAVESVGSIDTNIAQVAFVAWVLQWRQAEMTHNTAVAREAAAVIAKAPEWKAIADDRRVDPLYEQGFYWLLPFVRAVAAGDVNKVNELIASPARHSVGKYGGPAPYGEYFWGAGPDGFNAWWANYFKRWDYLSRKQQIAHGREEGVYFLRYLNRHGS